MGKSLSGILKQGKPFAFIVFIMVPLFVSGCAHKSPEMDSPATVSGAFTESGSDTMARRWWTEFEDPILNHLMERSLSGNLSLKQSWNRLEEARALVRREESDLGPAVDVNADYRDRKQRSGDNSTSISQSSQLGLSASYEVDLWGRIQSSVEATRYDRKATKQDLRASAISLTAEVTRTWFQLVEQYAQKQILEDQIETNRTVLKLVEKRFELGQVRAPDVLRQRRLVESTLQQKADVEATIKTLEHQLAALMGRVPNRRVNPVRISFPSVPEPPETGIPAEVINRRPDVHSAFLKVKAADKNVASAIANRYPRIDITASLTTDGADGGSYFDNWIQSLAADFALPLIDSGQRKANVSRSKAVLARRLNGYRDAVITAYREIEDALAREQKQRETIDLVKSQFKNAQKTVGRLRSQYLNGTVDYLDVLDALENKQQLERDLLRARQQLLDIRVSLYRSLAGGFETETSIESNYLTTVDSNNQ